MLDDPVVLIAQLVQQPRLADVFVVGGGGDSAMPLLDDDGSEGSPGPEFECRHGYCSASRKMFTACSECAKGSASGFALGRSPRDPSAIARR